jgi:hypothetical protein
VLKSVERNTMNCFNCNFEESCNGCIIKPQIEALGDFFARSNLIIEWHSTLIEEEYNPGSNCLLSHSEGEQEEEQQMTLGDCFTLFTKEENLDVLDGIHCSECREVQPSTKKIEIYRPPPVMVVQLKRFKEKDGAFVKIQNQVDFDLHSFSIAPFLADQGLAESLNISEHYDLYAMINHYGSLTYGHYVSVVKCRQDKGRWYQYDDNKAYLLGEDQVQEK